MNRKKVSVYVEKDAIEVSGLTFMVDDSGDYILDTLVLRHLPKEDEWQLFCELQDIVAKTPEECLRKARKQAYEVYMSLYRVPEEEPAPVDLKDLPF